MLCVWNSASVAVAPCCGCASCPALGAVGAVGLWTPAATSAGLAVAAAACCACGAATSAPAIATAGAALPAFSATFSTCEGGVCRPLRLNLTGRRSLRPADMLSPRVVASPGLRGCRRLSAGPLLSVDDDHVQFQAICIALFHPSRWVEAWQETLRVRRKIRFFCDLPVIKFSDNTSRAGGVTVSFVRTCC